MKVLVCGSREWTHRQAIYDRVAELPDDTTVIQGCALGADLFARNAAVRRGLFYVDVPCAGIHWDKHGPSAGHKRNHVMLDLGPDLVIAFQLNGSSGTQGTLDEARRRGIPVEIHSLAAGVAP